MIMVQLEFGSQLPQQGQGDLIGFFFFSVSSQNTQQLRKHELKDCACRKILVQSTCISTIPLFLVGIQSQKQSEGIRGLDQMLTI